MAALPFSSSIEATGLCGDAGRLLCAVTPPSVLPDACAARATAFLPDGAVCLTALRLSPRYLALHASLRELQCAQVDELCGIADDDGLPCTLLAGLGGLGVTGDAHDAALLRLFRRFPMPRLAALDFGGACCVGSSGWATLAKAAAEDRPARPPRPGASVRPPSGGGRFGDGVVSLNLSGTAVGDDDVATLAKAFPQLTELSLWGCDRVSGAALRSAALGCPQLRHLDLGGDGTQLADAALVHLRGLPLSQLTVGPWAELGDQGLLHLACLSALRSLELTAANLVSCPALVAALRGAPGLTHLTLAGLEGCGGQGDLFAEALCHLGALECLSLDGVCGGSLLDGHVRAVLAAAPGLRRVALRDYTRVTTDGLRIALLEHWGHGGTPRSLAVEQCDRVTRVLAEVTLTAPTVAVAVDGFAYNTA